MIASKSLTLPHLNFYPTSTIDFNEGLSGQIRFKVLIYPGCLTQDKGGTLLSRLGGSGWKIGTKGVFQPACFEVVN